MDYILSNAPHNKQLKIKDINILDDNLALRLTEIGFVSGQNITVFGAPTKHNKLVVVRNVLLSLDNNICQQVVVYD